jgi:hypothetical protein
VWILVSNSQSETLFILPKDLGFFLKENISTADELLGSLDSLLLPFVE